MLSIIYTYRDRDLKRVKRSLDSLEKQNNKDFQVFFVDYGSRTTFSEQIQSLCEQYDFVAYNYCYTQFQPWNKSRALNSVIKGLKTEFCFVADVDMIFHPNFEKNKSVYFQVGFLNKSEDLSNKTFDDFKKYKKSTFEATGLSMFPVRVLQKLKGFDEFYHFWGAEDTDMHERIKNAGYEVKFYNKKILMLHQWHNSYRSLEKNKISEKLQVKNIARYNHEHFRRNCEDKCLVVNECSWGETLSKEDFDLLEKLPVNIQLSTKTWEIDHFLFEKLPQLKNDIKVRIHKNAQTENVKLWLKRNLGKSVPDMYSLKEINDKLLMHIITFYRYKKYLYKVDPNLNYIEFTMLSNHVN
jgi:hypothetical protein